MRPKVTLYSTEGGSDKAYTIWVEPKGAQFVVQAQWGPRGGSVQSGTKTPVPVDEAKADATYDKTVKEKVSKGYHPGVDAPAFSQVDGATDSGLRPQLLTDASEVGPDRYIESDDWAGQQKMNGKRILLDVFPDGRVVGINRRGLECGIPQAVVDAFKPRHGGRGGPARQTPRLTLDGEMVGDVYHAFDLLLEDDDVVLVDRRSDTAQVRHYRLTSVLKHFLGDSIRVVPLVFGREAKKALVDELRSKRREGVVFKHINAVYEPGRVERLSLSSAVKCKFYAEVAACVIGFTDKSSIEVGLCGEAGVAGLVPVGKVTVAAKYIDQIESGKVVRVRYLYATPNRILYQANLDPTSDGSVLADQVMADPLSSLKLEGKEAD